MDDNEWYTREGKPGYTLCLVLYVPLNMTWAGKVFVAWASIAFLATTLPG